jgi:CRISPR system Cascade subunit CasC
MSVPRFVQIHYLTVYPASLLNRDDAGFAKRMPFGGATRIRVSSQCLKRHWRTFDGPDSLKSLCPPEEASVRSRLIFSEKIARPLKDEFPDRPVELVTKALADAVLGKSKGREEESGGGQHDLRTSQLIVLGNPEIEYIRKQAADILKQTASGATAKEVQTRVKAIGKDWLNNLSAIGRGAGLDAALFGRMKTSDLLADCDAAVHVAHAFTVHEEQAETDYFTAVDDLTKQAEDEAHQGAAHVNAAELTSGLFYGYVAVDVPLLVSNLEGVAPKNWAEANRSLAGQVVKCLVNLVATVSPGAKRGSTAPYSFADFVAVEAGNSQPCTWANAFFEPISSGAGLKDRALATLARQVGALNRMYPSQTQRRFASLQEVEVPGSVRLDSVQEVAGWAESAIKGDT